ncbi:MAG: L,D-transpeptidase, partial [Mesorhizobium sp.]|nr:L,D-transpeptidase [Mesorhizobium sp.]
MRVKTIFLAAALSAVLAGCSTVGLGPMQVFSNDYGARTDAGYQLPRIPIEKVPYKYRRQIVRYETDEKPGTIIVDTNQKFLYL